MSEYSCIKEKKEKAATIEKYIKIAIISLLLIGFAIIAYLIIIYLPLFITSFGGVKSEEEAVSMAANINNNLNNIAESLKNIQTALNE